MRLFDTVIDLKVENLDKTLAEEGNGLPRKNTITEEFWQIIVRDAASAEEAIATTDCAAKRREERENIVTGAPVLVESSILCYPVRRDAACCR